MQRTLLLIQVEFDSEDTVVNSDGVALVGVHIVNELREFDVARYLEELDFAVIDEGIEVDGLVDAPDCEDVVELSLVAIVYFVNDEIEDLVQQVVFPGAIQEAKLG